MTITYNFTNLYKASKKQFIVTKVDKGRTVVLMDKDVYQQKVETFVQ